MPINIETIRALELSILEQTGKPGPRKQQLPDELEAARVHLLEEHLGYKVQKPLPLLHVVGDSHTAFFSGCENIKFYKGHAIFSGFFRKRYASAFTELLPVFRVFHLGPATAWQANQRKSSTSAYEKILKLLKVGEIPPKAEILLVFGEIDIRCQIPKVVLNGSSVADATEQTALRFLKLVLELKARNYKPSVWLPTLIADRPSTESIIENNPIPVVGPQELRDEICAVYCERLQELCHENEIRCCGLPARANEPHHSLFIDGHHLSQNLMPNTLKVLIESEILPLKPIIP